MDTTRKSLLIRVRDRGDAAAWREFDEIYRPLLHRYARQCGLSDSDADDIVQQSMASLMSYVQKFEYDPCKGKFKGLLKTIAKNEVAKKKRRRRPKEADTMDFKRPQDREKDPEADFERLWEDEHLAHCLRQIRSEVKETTYQAFVKYALQERPVEEICQELDITPNQVHKAKWRITHKIRECLEHILGESSL